MGPQVNVPVYAAPLSCPHVEVGDEGNVVPLILVLSRGWDHRDAPNHEDHLLVTYHHVLRQVKLRTIFLLRWALLPYVFCCIILVQLQFGPHLRRKAPHQEDSLFAGALISDHCHCGVQP